MGYSASTLMAVVREEMIEVLKLMASTAAQQQAALPDFVVVADEIALLFDDELRLVDLDACQPAGRAELQSIDRRTNEMSNTVDLWTIDALRTATEWEVLRASARRLLERLGVALGPPDLYWVTYVRG
jgi:hypothetical protein